MFSRAIALLSCRFTASKRPQDVVSLFMRKKYARLKLKLPTQNGELIVFPLLIVKQPVKKMHTSLQVNDLQGVRVFA